MTAELYDGMAAAMSDQLRNSAGFIAHYSQPIEGGFEVVELWESRAEFDAWYNGTVMPAVAQAGINPETTVTEVHNVIAI
jgi:heme-degrading monooxygenase HmoA